MKKFLAIAILISAFLFVSVLAVPQESEAWHGRSAFFVGAGPAFYGFPFGLSYATFSRRSAFSISLAGFAPWYYYPYPAAPVYYSVPVYYEPVYYERRIYRDRLDDDWVRDAEEFLRGGK